MSGYKIIGSNDNHILGEKILEEKVDWSLAPIRHFLSGICLRGEKITDFASTTFLK